MTKNLIFEIEIPQPVITDARIIRQDDGMSYTVTLKADGHEHGGNYFHPETMVEAAETVGALATSGPIFRMYHPGEGKNYAFTTVKTTTGEWTARVDELIASVADEYADRIAAYLYGRYSYMFGWEGM